MKKLAFILCLMAWPAFAEEPAKPVLWLMAIQLKASTLSVTYTSEASCKAAAKLSNGHMAKLGRADCIPVVQP